MLSAWSRVYIEAESDIRIGDKVITSGIGGVYPRGLLVGRVSAIEVDEASRTLTAIIEPAADLDSISKVMIVTEYGVIEEGADGTE